MSANEDKKTMTMSAFPFKCDACGTVIRSAAGVVHAPCHTTPGIFGSMRDFAARGLATQLAVDRLVDSFQLIEDCAAAWRCAVRAKEAGELGALERNAIEATRLSVELAERLRE